MGYETLDFKQEQNEAPEQDRERQQDFGSEALNLTKSFEDVKKEDKVPEGVRDEQDYKEYLAEREARIGESEKIDREIFEGIMSIEDPNDRDLAVAILPYYYNEDLVAGRNETWNKAERVSAEIAIKAVINYMKGDKTESLKYALRQAANKNLNYYGEILCDGYLDGILDLLSTGQRIERLDLSEAEFDKNINGYVFDLNPGHSGNRKFFHVGPDQARDPMAVEDTRATLVLANDIAKQVKENGDHEKNLPNLCKIDELKEAFWYGGGAHVSEELYAERDRRMHDVVHSTKAVMDRDDYDRKSASLPVDGALAQFVYLDELIGTFENYKNADRVYKNALELGKSILGGEDYRKISRDAFWSLNTVKSSKE